MVRKVKKIVKKKEISQDEINHNKRQRKMKKEGTQKECLLKEYGGCEGKIISAHSIQNNRFLKKISKNGDIITFTSNNSGEEEKIKFDTEGRGQFSTFFGFCKKHDKELFQPIEDKEYESTIKQKYLFTFRTLSKEFHTKKEMLNMYSILQKKYPFHPNVSAMRENHAKDLESIKKEFDVVYREIQNERYDSLVTKEFILDNEFPIVTNGAFIPRTNSKNQLIFNEYTYEMINKGEIDPVIFLNVFPSNKKTYILITYFKKYEKLLNFFMDDFKSGIERKVSLMIIKHCEVVGFNPDYVQNKFTSKEKKEILKNFGKNLFSSLEEVDPTLNLFR